MTRIFSRIRRAHIIGGIFVVTALLISDYALTWSGGKTGQTQKPGSGNGCTCHCANANTSTSVSVSTSATTFEGGSTYSFSVTVASSDGNHSKAGFNAAVSRGALNVSSDNTVQKIGSEVTHTGPKNLTATWTFSYTAPSTAGGDTIYVTGNAVNNDGLNGSGNCSDKWNHAAKFVMNIVVPTRELSLTKTSVPLGNVRVGTSKQDTLRIISTGESAITISSSAMKNSTPFGTSPTGTNRSLSPGTQEVNTITFTPTARGSFVDTFVVNSNSTTTSDQRKTVVVTGAGIQAIFTGNNSLPFGNVKVGQMKDLAYTYQNTGDDTLYITNASLSSSTFFSIQGSPPATIAPGGGGTVNLRFTPVGKQNYSTQLTFTALNGITTPTVTLSGTGTAPQLSTAGLIQIGAIKLGALGSQNLDFENIGNDTLTITSVAVALGEFQSQKFSVSAGGTGTILPGGKKSVIITYTPTEVRNDTAKIVVSSNDPQLANREILVIGRGALPTMKITAPDTVKFGDVRIGSSATKAEIAIENTGEAELLITNITTTPSQFSIVSPPNSVGGKGSVALQVKFTPTAEGELSGMVAISGDDAKLPRDTVYLLGRGTVSQFDTPPEINFGDQKIATSRDSVFYLRNLGSASLTIRSYAITSPAGIFQALDTSKHTINAKDSIAVKVRFNAQAEQSYSGILTVTTTESSNATRNIVLLGRGINSKLALSDASIDFGEVDTGKSASRDLVITNIGTAAVSVNELTLSGAGLSAYSVEHSALPKTLQPADTLMAKITFAPTGGVSYDASLGIAPDEGSTLNVLLHGAGKVDTSGTGGVRSAYHLDLPFRLSPNPSRGGVTAMFELAATDRIGFAIYSSDGKVVSEVDAAELPSGAHEVRLDTEALPSGKYIVRLINGKGQFAEERVVIVK